MTMKNFICNFLLTFLLIFSSNSICSIEENIVVNRQSIEKAIKHSNPDMLEKYLANYKTTAIEKQCFIDFANKITELRRSNLCLDLIRPKTNPNFNPKGERKLGIACGVIGTLCLTLGLISEGDYVLLIPTGLLSMSASAFLLYIWYKFKDRPYIRFRTRKQKYLDSIKVQHLIFTINLVES